MKVKFIPDSVEESGLYKVISYIWKYRRRQFIRYSVYLQTYLLILFILCGAKIILTGNEDVLSFGLFFILPAIFGYGILSVIYVILYVDVLKNEKRKRVKSLRDLTSANRA